jgi:uncharacterized protein CbrC (UPF0167 family)
MNATDIIRQVQENASEWLEMVEDPAALVAGILANKIIKLTDHIQYLENRLKHVSQQEIRSHSRRI